LTAEQLKRSKKLREEYQALKNWALEPTEISPKSISRFVKTVRDGLMNEGHHQPIHTLHYIDWVLGAIDIQLRMFNKQVKESLGVS
jgi:hypothetical protein